MVVDLAPEKPAAWFVRQGIGVFPIRPQGKEPLVKWLEHTCTPEQAATYINYGVKLGKGYGVIDTDSHESEEFISGEIAAGNIPATPFMVLTARGLHRYYKLRLQTPKFIRRNGIPIEFRNDGQYVVGPGSIHPSGAVYTANDWSWNVDDVPVFPADFCFDDGSCGARNDNSAMMLGDLHYEFPDNVTAGERHHELFKQLRSLKALGNSREAVWWCIQQANANFCKPPLPLAGLQRWFDRGWDNPDRPLDSLKGISLQGLGLNL